jgi:GH25 family lysozyme M1 (1,4-beta-N-acetylmuramidase)
MPEGIDVYIANQTVTSWSQVRASDIDWCYQKVSDGSGTRQINPGPFAGVAQGGYHFSQPGSPVDQANLLVNRCEALGLIDLNPALDLEDNPPTSGRANIPNNQKAAFAINFGRQVLARGHGFTLYANDSTWQSIYNQVMSALPQTFRWVARYRTAPPITPYDAWQYTSSGSCPGISTGSLDRNRGKKPLNRKNVDMPLADPDFKYLFYDTKIQEFGNLSQLLEYVKLTVKGTATAVDGLKNLIIADDANDVTAEGVANALRGLIQAELVPAVVASVDSALAGLEVNVDNAALSDSIIAKLKELAFKAV